MPRLLKDWLQSYVKYASVTEAPKHMHFWAGVSAVAGALRKHVWIDMKRFKWVPNFYIVFVAPPGVVSKSTTIDISMGILREVPGIKFGPDIVTWQALVGSFAAACESFPYGDEYIPMSPLTLASSEWGTLIDPRDRAMINLYIDLWDGRKGLEKVTKTSGNDSVDSPWINMIACTTPHWIADNMPTATVGGGFTSRCVFVYADSKEKYIAFVDEQILDGDDVMRQALIHDLEHIAVNLIGPYTISKEARDWYRPIYEAFWRDAASRMDDQMLEGYAARKQTMTFKLAMVIAASSRDELVITQEDAQLATLMLENLEPNMRKVFSRIGRTEESLNSDVFVNLIRRHGELPYKAAYAKMREAFPNHKDFEGIFEGAIRSGAVTLTQRGDEFWIVAVK